MRTSHLAVGIALVLALSTGTTSPSTGVDARISALESEVAALRASTDVRVPELEPRLDAFLHVPGIRGDSVRDGHEDEIEVFAWTSGVRAGSARDIAVLKEVDRASVPLFVASASGAPISEAILTFRHTVEGETSDYLVITLHNVVISGVEHGIGGGFELVTLSAAKVVMTFDDTVEGGWDFVARGPV